MQHPCGDMSKPFLQITKGEPSLLTQNVPYEDIHPMMPHVIQGRLAGLCQYLGVSYWDREKVYNHLKEMARETIYRTEA